MCRRPLDAVCDPMNGVLRRETITSNLAGVPTEFDVTVTQTYATTINFTFCGQPYTFTITKWALRQFKKFAVSFHQHCQRAAVDFGCIEDTDERTDIKMDVGQKTKAVMHSCEDIVKYLDKLLHEQSRAILDYAVWYREKHSEEDTYATFIMKLTCHLIIHSDFFNPTVRWTVTPFI